MKSKRLLYISAIENGPYQGVWNKINMQCNALTHLGIDVYKLNSGKRSFVGQLEKLIPTSYGVKYRELKKKVLEFDNDFFDYCYIRFSPISRGFIDILKILRKNHPRVEIILEIPTYPYQDEMKTLKALPFKIRDELYNKKLKEYVDLVVTPSHLEKTQILNIPAYEITNGIDLNCVTPREINCERNKETINIIGVALLTPKQGFDRVIRGIHNYNNLKADSDPTVKFYIVGSGAAMRDLKSLTSNFDICEDVIFTGEKKGDDLQKLYDIADLGIGTIGLYRTNELKKVNSLKTREYCAKGLPFVITPCDHVFADRNFKYCYIVDDNDCPLDINDLIVFLKDLRDKEPSTEIVANMRLFAKEHLSWDVILGSVLAKADSMKQ